MPPSLVGSIATPWWVRKTTSIGKYGAMHLGSGWPHVLGGATGPLDEAGWLADGMHLSRGASPGTDADAVLERRTPDSMTVSRPVGARGLLASHGARG
jgi:hypothetical protein